MKTVRYSTEVEGGHRSGTLGNRSQTAFTIKQTTLEAVPRAEALVRMAVERVELGIRTGKDGKEYAFDTDALKPEAELSPIEKGMTVAGRFVGHDFELRMRPDGKLSKFENMESMRSRMTEGLPEKSPGRLQLMKMTERLPMHHQFATLSPMPAKSYTVGSSWTFADLLLLPETTSVPGMLYLKGKGRLASVENGIATIELSGKVTLDPPDASAPPLHPKLAEFRKLLRLQSGAMTGSAKMRVADGVLLEAEQVYELDLHFVKIGDAGEVPMPTTLTRRIKVLEE